MGRASSNDEEVTFECVFKHRTEKAILVVIDGQTEDSWIPESAVVRMTHPQGFAGEGSITIEKWLALKRGWI